MFSNLKTIDRFWIFVGLLLMIGSGYVVASWRTYPLATGLFFIGIGSGFCGLTGGFSNPTPTGVLLRKTGILAFLIGFLLTAYSLY